MGSKEKQFEALVNAFSAALYRYAYWLCGDRNIAEDLVQETFTRAWKALNTLKNEAAIKGWLFTILQRENARRFERYNPITVDIEKSELADLLADSPDFSMERSILLRTIMQLKPEYREPLVMQVLGGFSYEEIAKELKLEKATVVMRLYRAKRKLQNMLLNDTTELETMR